MKPKTKILIIAGSDSSGGAGIQADIKTVTSSLGGYAMTAVTAITAYKIRQEYFSVSLFLQKKLQIKLFTAKDIKPDAIKIGMLHSQEVIQKCCIIK